MALIIILQYLLPIVVFWEFGKKCEAARIRMIHLSLMKWFLLQCNIVGHIHLPIWSAITRRLLNTAVYTTSRSQS